MPLLALDWALTRRVDDGQNAGFALADALSVFDEACQKFPPIE